MTCQFCEEPAVGVTQLLMCVKHLDLAILCGYLREKGEPVTVESVQQLWYICHSRNGALDLEIEDIEPMLAGEFLERYEVQGSGVQGSELPEAA